MSKPKRQAQVMRDTLVSLLQYSKDTHTVCGFLFDMNTHAMATLRELLGALEAGDVPSREQVTRVLTELESSERMLAEMRQRFDTSVAEVQSIADVVQTLAEKRKQ